MKCLIGFVFLGIFAQAQEIQTSAKRCQVYLCPKRFWLLTATQAIVTSIDGYQTAQSRKVEVGSSWLYGSYPDRHNARLGFTMAGEFGISAVASKALQHTRFRRFWMSPQSALIGTHTEGVIHNATWSAPVRRYYRPEER